MKITTSNSKVALTLLCCSIAATWASGQTLPSAINTPFAGAVISGFKGNVGVQLPNQPLAAPVRGDTLPAETVITTEGGRMLLRLQDGSEVLLRPHTRVVLKQPTATDWRYLQLLIGRIRTQVQKRFGGSTSFQIGTPSAVISVRGTRFDVEVNSRNVTEVDVVEGIVQLESIQGTGAPVLITAGFSSRVGPDSLPEVPRPTEELRPQVERPDRENDKELDRDHDNLIEKLRSEDRERGAQEKRDGQESDPKSRQSDPSDPR